MADQISQETVEQIEKAVEQVVAQVNTGNSEPAPQSYQDRVRTEKADLDSKIAKLDAFITDGTSAYHTLNPEARIQLKQQANFMRGYSDILGERISTF